MAGKQRLTAGFPSPVYVNETATKQRIAPSVFINETVPTNVSLTPGAGSLALTKYAATLLNNLGLSPGNGTLTLNGYAAAPISGSSLYELLLLGVS